MRELDFEALVITVLGKTFSILDISSTIYCARNVAEVTNLNWVASIVLAVAGVAFVIIGIWVILSNRRHNG